MQISVKVPLESKLHNDKEYDPVKIYTEHSYFSFSLDSQNSSSTDSHMSTLQLGNTENHFGINLTSEEFIPGRKSVLTNFTPIQSTIDSSSVSNIFLHTDLKDSLEASECPSVIALQVDVNSISESNISLDPDKLNIAQKICHQLKSTKPSAVCCICGKILYDRMISWIKSIPESEWLAKNLVPPNSPVQILIKDTDKVSGCNTCKTKYQTGGMHMRFNFFNDYGQQPPCFSELKSYSEIRKISIGSLYCSTFKKPGYNYLHMHGNVKICKNTEDNLRGMVGILHDGDNPELAVDPSASFKCLHWLKKNNSLYNSFLSNLETMHGYTKTSESSGLFCGLPKRTDDIHILNDGQLSSEVIENKTGLIVPIHNFEKPSKPCNLDKIVVGKVVCKNDKVNKVQNITYADENLEAKIFPHLFPFGKGSWNKSQGCSSLTLGQYHKHRLLHVDRRWANDRMYPFFTYDRNIKVRLFYINGAIASNKNRETPLKSSTLSKNTEYFMFGNVINATIPGSKAFWEKNWLDLVARVSHFGPGDIFFTLTFNEGWTELKEILNQYETKASILHPVEPTVYFHERFHAIKPLLMGKDCVFGKCSHYWYRIEAQNRGALHIHGILWLEENTMKENSVVAELPRGDDPQTEALREMVKKYQVHHCLTNRCFRTWKGIATDKCKYGFPFSLRRDEGYDKTGTRLEYKRSMQEDQRVVPYNPILLFAWQAHLNVQKITNTGLERYLVKYISKVEPSFTADVEINSEVSRYLVSRLVGAPEAIATQLSYPMVDSDTKVKYIDTNIPTERSRVLKPLPEIKELDPESTDIFLDGPREAYEKRPKDFETMLYPDYTCKYKVVNKAPKKGDHFIDLKDRIIVSRSPMVPRYRFLTASDGEVFYYQQLLLNVPFRCEEDLLSPDNESGTFKEECHIRELFLDKDELDVSFKEMKKRNFDPQNISRIAKKMLNENLADHKTLSKKITALEYGEYIPLEDSELASYESVSLGEDVYDIDPDIKKIVVFNKQKILAERKDLEMRKEQLTQSQRRVFEYVKETQSQILAFITGPGGTGKSFLLATILLELESQGYMVEVLATTGNAAQLIGGQTVHSFFKLSVDLEKTFSYRDQTWCGIAATDIIIIDEVSMMSAELLEVLDSICRDVVGDENKNRPFGGKSIILFGDLYQLPAVMRPPSYRQIYSSQLWTSFVPFFLEESCRQKDDKKFQILLNRVREGKWNQEDLDVLHHRICGVGHDKTDECDRFTDPFSFVICSKHADKNKINEEIQERILSESPMYQLRAYDYDEAGNFISHDMSDMLDSVQGVMNRQLVLRLGAKVMITRNLDIVGSVVNGTPGILKAVHKKVLMIERLDGSEIIPVPRVKQRAFLKPKGINVYRVQFPIILSWACTVHRTQGMTLERAYVYLDKTFFAPGQAYVAISRVSQLENLHLLAFQPKGIMVNDVVLNIMDHAHKNAVLKIGNSKPSRSYPKKRKDDEQLPYDSKIKKDTDNRFSGEQTFDSNSEEGFSTEFQKEHNSHSQQKNAKSLKDMQQKTLKKLRFNLGHKLFNPPNLEEIRKVVALFNPTLKQFRVLLQNLHPYVTEREVRIDYRVSEMLPNAILEQYVPVKTTGDGNCLWNAISLSLTGSEDNRLSLRLLTVACISEHGDFFINIFDQDTIREGEYGTEMLSKQLKIARTDKAWGNEFHLLALSIVLQKDIFVYSSFCNSNFISEKTTQMQLKTAFQQRKHLGTHLIYSTPLQFKNQNYRYNPLCLFFDANARHYTAILRKKKDVTLFRPYTSLFRT